MKSVYGRLVGCFILTMLPAATQFLGAVSRATETTKHQWTSAHVDNLADLYVSAIEQAKAGELSHAGAESRLRTKTIAGALSTGLGLGGKTVELEILVN